MPDEPSLEVQWDVFVSHASEDKGTIVRELADELTKIGVATWYDEMTLKLGDSLRRSIDQGLSKSKAGIIVLSKAFISKDWPQYELDGLTALALDGSVKIIPVWHGLSRKEVLRFSPTLADRFAVNTENMSPKAVAEKIAEVVRPDIFQKILRRRVYDEVMQNGEVVTLDPKSIRMGPLRHENLTAEQMIQVRLIRASLLLTYPHSQEFWIDGFRRDMNPDREISWWMRISSVVMEYISFKGINKYTSENLIGIIFKLSMGSETEKNAVSDDKIDVEFLKASLAGLLSPYDIDDRNIFAEDVVTNEDE